MRTRSVLIILFSLFTLYGFTQNNNGKIDMMEELAEKTTVPFTMPDGTKLMTDIYLPVLQDSLTMKVPTMDGGLTVVELIPKGTQYIYYDTLNGEKAENPYELPVIFLRTPYNKDTESLGYIMAFLGYAVVIQDNRGTHESEGVYLPMYSDAWSKIPYHPNIKHALDMTLIESPHNANRHEDGYNSLKQIHRLVRQYNNTTIKISNGNIGMIGYSALGNAQYQLAAARKIDAQGPGLKALMPIVATNEHYRFTAVQNGVFREQLVTGWIRDMYHDLLDNSLMEKDNDMHNNMHSPMDYNLTNKSEAAEKAIDFWMVSNPNGQPAGYYPNSPVRPDLDASCAPVNEHGEGAADGKHSRYNNMNVPIYHLTGWWDIFIDGQIETYNNVMVNLSDEKTRKLQKLVIGPWAHQTITEQKTGDVTYPENVTHFLYDPMNVQSDLENMPLEELLESEILQWFRYNLNFNNWKNTGLPKVIIPKAKDSKLSDYMSLTAPSEDYVLGYDDFINYLSGNDSIRDLPYTLTLLDMENKMYMDVPPLDKPVLNIQGKMEESDITNFEKIPNVRLYVAGPQDDQYTGNYWLSADAFPLSEGVDETAYYFHADGLIQPFPSYEEGAILSYIHDPDNPVMTGGGANMITRTPETRRKNQGQMNLASEELRSVSMDRPDVLSFETPPLMDSLSIIGFPSAKIFAASMPIEDYSDSTNTDFMIRIADVYPNGETYFVAEGVVNARARDYVRQLAEGEEDPTIPFTNIASGEAYEYHFKMMPIAYTFGRGHKIKILISSSNYPRYQSNPNLPLEPGEFFRREPGEDKSYSYNGEEMQARKAEQTIYFSSDMPSQIILPVYGSSEIHYPTEISSISRSKWNVRVSPNPADDYILINSDLSGNKVEVYDVSGRKITEKTFESSEMIDVHSFHEGIYILKVLHMDSGITDVRRIIKK